MYFSHFYQKWHGISDSSFATQIASQVEQFQMKESEVVNYILHSKATIKVKSVNIMITKV
jgi:hypothetical protein